MRIFLLGVLCGILLGVVFLTNEASDTHLATAIPQHTLPVTHTHSQVHTHTSTHLHRALSATQSTFSIILPAVPHIHIHSSSLPYIELLVRQGHHKLMHNFMKD